MSLHSHGVGFFAFSGLPKGSLPGGFHVLREIGRACIDTICEMGYARSSVEDALRLPCVLRTEKDVRDVFKEFAAECTLVSLGWSEVTDPFDIARWS